MTGHKKRIVCVMLLVFVMSSVLAVFPIAQALSWALSVKDGTWTMKAFDAVVPGAGQVVSFVMDPQGAILGEGLGQLKQVVGPEVGGLIDCVLSPQSCATQVTLEQIAKENPEAFGILSEVLAVKAQLEELGFTDGNVELDKDGNVKKISAVNLDDFKVHNIGNILGKNFAPEDVQAANVGFLKEDGITTFVANADARIIIKVNGKERVYQGMKELSMLRFDENGEVVEADIRLDSGGSFDIGGRTITGRGQWKGKDARIQWKNNELTLTGKDGAIFGMATEEEKKLRTSTLVTMMSDKGIVRIKGNEVSGEDFVWDDGLSRVMHFEKGGFLKQGDKFLLSAESVFDPQPNYLWGNKVKVGKTPVEVVYNVYDNPQGISESEAKISGPIEFEDARHGRNFEVKGGSFGIFSTRGKYRLYGGTELAETQGDVAVREMYEGGVLVKKTQAPEGLEEGDTITTFRSSKDLDFYVVPGRCDRSGNCLESTPEKILMRAGGNAKIEIRNPGKTIKELNSRRIVDESGVLFAQENVEVNFGKRNIFSVKGDLTQTSLDVIDGEYAQGNEVRFAQWERGSSDAGKIFTGRDCSEDKKCASRSIFIDEEKKLRLKALNYNRREVSTFLQEAKQKYGPEMRIVVPFKYFDDAREERLREVFTQVTREYDVDPSLMAASMFREGWHIFIEDAYYKNPEGSVHGFGTLGLDVFGSDYKDLMKKDNQGKPYLRQELSEGKLSEGADFELVRQKNEKDEEVLSANFRNMDVAMQAFAATLRQRQDFFLRDSNRLGLEKALGRKLSQDELAYGTYLYYNAGPGLGRERLQEAVREKKLLPKPSDLAESSGITGPKLNAMSVVLARQMYNKVFFRERSTQTLVAL